MARPETKLLLDKAYRVMDLMSDLQDKHPEIEAEVQEIKKAFADFVGLKGMENVRFEKDN